MGCGVEGASFGRPGGYVHHLHLTCYVVEVDGGGWTQQLSKISVCLRSIQPSNLQTSKLWKMPCRSSLQLCVVWLLDLLVIKRQQLSHDRFTGSINIYGRPATCSSSVIGFRVLRIGLLRLSLTCTWTPKVCKMYGCYFGC